MLGCDITFVDLLTAFEGDSEIKNKSTHKTFAENKKAVFLFAIYLIIQFRINIKLITYRSLFLEIFKRIYTEVSDEFWWAFWSGWFTFNNTKFTKCIDFNMMPGQIKKGGGERPLDSFSRLNIPKITAFPSLLICPGIMLFQYTIYSRQNIVVIVSIQYKIQDKN